MPRVSIPTTSLSDRADDEPRAGFLEWRKGLIRETHRHGIAWIIEKALRRYAGDAEPKLSRVEYEILGEMLCTPWGEQIEFVQAPPYAEDSREETPEPTTAQTTTSPAEESATPAPVVHPRDHAAFVAEAERQRSLGRGIVWLTPGEKVPKRSKWTESSDEPQNGIPGDNIGILTGRLSGDLVCVDLDGDKARELAHLHLPPTGMIDGRPGNRCSHWWYKVTDVPPSMSAGPDVAKGIGGPWIRRSGKNKAGFDFQGTGAQVAIPPSVHHTGEVRIWEADGEPAVVRMVDLWAAVEALAVACGHPIKFKDAREATTPAGKAATGSLALLRRATNYLRTIDPAIEKDGGRERTWQAACLLVRDFGLTVEAGYPILKDYNRRAVPPWSDAALMGVLTRADAEEKEPRGAKLRIGERAAMASRLGRLSRLLTAEGDGIDREFCYKIEKLANKRGTLHVRDVVSGIRPRRNAEIAERHLKEMVKEGRLERDGKGFALTNPFPIC